MKSRIFSLLLIGLSFILGAQTVTVDWNDVRQTIDGFGASDAWFADELITHPDRSELLDLLFSTETGAGLSILRHRIPPNMADWEDGAMELTSNDLDFGTVAFHGVRFQNINIPPAAVIEQAYIQFTAKDDLSAPCVLQINGQAADNAPTFEITAGNISGRPLTLATVSWNVPVWIDKERTSKQQTPDLKEIVQEVVNRSGWQSGNSLVIILQNLTGKRSAYTFDNNPAQAPELVIRFHSSQTLSRKVIDKKDDAEEHGTSYLTYGARLTKEAFARGCEKVWAAAWTPPAEWKTNANHSQGGFLKSPHYQDWADRLELYRAEMEKRSGIPLYGISPQNEPGYKTWESCEWQATQFRDFIKKHLGPTLAPDCRIIVPEETNWDNVEPFYRPIHNDPQAAVFVGIVAGHVYGGNPNTSYNHFGKPVWETEWSYDTSAEDLGINNGLVWAINFWRLLVNAEVSACHHWWLVNFNDDGKQQGLIAATPNTPGYKVAKRLWTLGNYSKFVRSGWQRISATKTPADNVFIAAFKNNESREFAVVAINNSSKSQKLTFRLKGFNGPSVTPNRTSSFENLAELEALPADSSFTAELPAKTVTTFIGQAVVSDVSSRRQDTYRPERTVLKQNHPNPFNFSTTIEYSLAESLEVSLDVFDINGRRVKNLVCGEQPAGDYAVYWNALDEIGRKVPSGVYICRLRIATDGLSEERCRKISAVR